MEIRSRLSENILKLKLRGRLDSASAEDFYSYLKSKWEEGIRKFYFPAKNWNILNPKELRFSLGSRIF
ncbi:hypothetical protein LEP1GSC115_2220 [Leptospira interrogans serovar Australis str. 200703203]|uniref:Uncharacterized protein n=1 Tax=Leptospira interrogans serovar Australis str. 200703203 TaxID=1085541 RepID=N1UJR1_LEPIR|nr:hypothetical protein LEP1GSC115_2220 [Leptospira interrogans serovar Australis str. 200703203]